VSLEPINHPALTTTQLSGMSLDKIELKTERLGGAGLSSSSIKISGSLRAVELAVPMVQSMLATAEETWSRAARRRRTLESLKRRRRGRRYFVSV